MNTKLERTRLISKLGFTNLILYSDQLRYQQKKDQDQVWSRSTADQPTAREEEPQNTNSHRQEDNLSKATSSLFPIKIMAKDSQVRSDYQPCTEWVTKGLTPLLCFRHEYCCFCAWAKLTQMTYCFWDNVKMALKEIYETVHQCFRYWEIVKLPFVSKCLIGNSLFCWTRI